MAASITYLRDEIAARNSDREEHLRQRSEHDKAARVIDKKIRELERELLEAYTAQATQPAATQPSLPLDNPPEIPEDTNPAPTHTESSRGRKAK